jgi:hypothetical protein
LYEHLILTHSGGGAVVGAGTDVYVRPGWLFLLLTAALKAASGKRQGFGYAAFLRELAKLGTSELRKLTDLAAALPIELPHELRSPRTVEYGLRDWFSGAERTNFDLRPFELLALAGILASKLSQLPAADPSALLTQAQEMESQDLIENVLIPFNKFQPLKLLLEMKLKEDGIPYRNVSYYPSPMYEKLVAMGQRINVRASSTSVIVSKQTILRWITVSDEGRDHKRKEFGGRAAILPVTWSEDHGDYRVRSGVKRLLLLVDGTFRDADLRVLSSLGWDGIFYPNELDRLVESIE